MGNKNHDHDVDHGVNLISYQYIYQKLANDRHIFLSEAVTKKSAMDVCTMLLYFDNQSNDPINLYINTNGGDVNGLISIYDVMRMIHSPVHTYCIGKAYSAGAVILAAGEPGNRYAFENSEVMAHGIQFVFPIPGEDLRDSKDYLKFIDDNNDKIMSILSEHTKRPMEEIKPLFSRDFWMSAKKAKEFGFVDWII